MRCGAWMDGVGCPLIALNAAGALESQSRFHSGEGGRERSQPVSQKEGRQLDGVLLSLSLCVSVSGLGISLAPISRALAPFQLSPLYIVFFLSIHPSIHPPSHFCHCVFRVPLSSEMRICRPVAIDDELCSQAAAAGAGAAGASTGSCASPLSASRLSFVFNVNAFQS